MSATKPRSRIAGIEPYMPKIPRVTTGYEIELADVNIIIYESVSLLTYYRAPILPVRVMTTEHIMNPQNTMGRVDLQLLEPAP